MLRAIVDATARGDTDEVHAIYARWLPMIVFEQQPGVAVRKEVYRLRGIAESGTVRHPGGQLAPGSGNALRDVLARVLRSANVDLTQPLDQQYLK